MISKNQTTVKPTLAQPRMHDSAHAEVIARILGIAPIGEYDAWVNYTPRWDESCQITDTAVYHRIVDTPDDVLMAWFREGEKKAKEMRNERN